MKSKSPDIKKIVNEGLLGLAVAGLAGVYFLHGKDGAKNKKKVRAWILKGKGEVLEKLEKAKDVTEDNYHNAIDMVAAKYAKAKDIAPEEVEAFSKELKKHWKDIKAELAPKAKKVAKKAPAKAAKKAIKK